MQSARTQDWSNVCCVCQVPLIRCQRSLVLYSVLPLVMLGAAML